MTTLIKTKFKKSDDQTNIDKYRVAANITEYHIISNLINYFVFKKVGLALSKRNGVSNLSLKIIP